jgi:hypothetical protein
MLSHLCRHARIPILIGTWTAAVWAIRFYQNHGFKIVDPEEKELLLMKYWNVSRRQIEASVVLASPAWFDRV